MCRWYGNGIYQPSLRGDLVKWYIQAPTGTNSNKTCLLSIYPFPVFATNSLRLSAINYRIAPRSTHHADACMMTPVFNLRSASSMIQLYTCMTSYFRALCLELLWSFSNSESYFPVSRFGCSSMLQVIADWWSFSLKALNFWLLHVADRSYWRRKNKSSLQKIATWWWPVTGRAVRTCE